MEMRSWRTFGFTGRPTMPVEVLRTAMRSTRVAHIVVVAGLRSCFRPTQTPPEAAGSSFESGQPQRVTAIHRGHHNSKMNWVMKQVSCSSKRSIIATSHEIDTIMSGFLPGNISLIDQLDKKILVVLRDGRHLVGFVRSFDQYSNIILEDTYERHVAGGLFCDIELGLNIIRGDNIVLLGELDEDKERDQPHMKRASMEEVLEAEEQANASGSGGGSVRAQWEFDAAGL